MEQLVLCRMCLVDDVPMRLIKNKYLQAMFERITDVPFVREDRPILMCYICCARLHNCYKFRNNCVHSEELLQQMLNSKLTLLKLKQLRKMKMFSVTKVANISCSGVVLDNTDINGEGQTSAFYNVEVKKEITEGENIESSEEQRYIEQNGSSQWSNTKQNPLNEYKFSHNIPLKTEKDAIQTCDDIIDEKPGPQRVIQTQTNEDTITNIKKELTEEEASRKSCVAVTFYNCNNESREFEHIVTDTSSCSYKPLAHETSQKQHNKISNKVKRFECDICNKHFNVKENLINHICIHTGAKLYNCCSCSKSFNKKSSLIKHNRIHSGENPYKCYICSKSFYQKSALLTHSRVHTGEKPYRCNICSKCFTLKDSLVKHNRIHTGDKPFKCNTCNKCFIKNNDLVRHNRIHTGDKPYKCDICSKSFTQKGHLMAHNRIHTGDKPYKCNICSLRFSEKTNLVKHNRIHHGNKPYKIEPQRYEF